MTGLHRPQALRNTRIKGPLQSLRVPSLLVISIRCKASRQQSACTLSGNPPTHAHTPHPTPTTQTPTHIRTITDYLPPPLSVRGSAKGRNVFRVQTACRTSLHGGCALLPLAPRPRKSIIHVRALLPRGTLRPGRSVTTR